MKIPPPTGARPQIARRLQVTRRSLARVLAVAAALPVAGSAQDRPGDAAAAAAANDVTLNAARDEYRTAGRALGAIKIPRSLEPATRFEA